MQTENILGVIPARYASTRFPGKPLAIIGGISMIQRVYIQAAKSKLLSKIIVATDDERIAEHVKSFGGNVFMTSTAHQTGTARCAEVLKMQKEKYDVLINIQGDEPFINPSQIDAVINQFMSFDIEIATLVKRITTVEELQNPNVVKVVLNSEGNALLFSRSVIPFHRNTDAETALKQHNYLKHIGIYGYRTDILEEIDELPETNLEKAESLEQLRWLQELYMIHAAETTEESYAVDTPEDVTRIEKLLAEKKISG